MGKVASAIGGANPYIAGGQALLNTGLGLAQMISGAKEKNQARNALENYQRQQLKNVQENRTVSTLGSDLQREEAARLAATQVDALRGGGTRALVGGLGRVEAGNQRVNQQISADLDMQQKEIDAAIAQDDANIRAMQENREIGDIAALSSQYQSGKQDQNTGIGNSIMGAGMLGGSIAQIIQDNKAKNDGSGGSGGYSVGGYAPAPNTPMTPSSMRYAPESGYGNSPILTNPAYNPQNFGPQNAYGVFNQRYPYGNVYGPQQP